MDIVYPGHRHIPFATLGDEVARRTVTLTATGKSFNIAGLRCAVAIFGSPALRERFEALPSRLCGAVNVLGLRASITAWTEGGPWLDAAAVAGEPRRRGRVRPNRLPDARHRRPRTHHLA
jgi:cystathionine beta-lyase